MFYASTVLARFRWARKHFFTRGLGALDRRMPSCSVRLCFSVICKRVKNTTFIECAKKKCKVVCKVEVSLVGWIKVGGETLTIFPALISTFSIESIDADTWHQAGRVPHSIRKKRRARSWRGRVLADIRPRAQLRRVMLHKYRTKRNGRICEKYNSEVPKFTRGNSNGALWMSQTSKERNNKKKDQKRNHIGCQ